jgi:hypothetical protein
MNTSSSPFRPIATLQEGPLHAALKAWYAEQGDREEVPVEGRQIDLVRGELLIEIQTGSFAALRRKLAALVETHAVRVVYPIPVEKWIVRVKGDEMRLLGRRKSRKRGRIEDAFHQLANVPTLLAHPRFSLEIVLTQEEEVRRHEPGRAWRRKGWVVVERRLLDVIGRRLIREPRDLTTMLPHDLPPIFTTADLAKGLGVTRDLAQKMAYCLRRLDVIEATGKAGNALAYRLPAAVCSW